VQDLMIEEEEEEEEEEVLNLYSAEYECTS
jgi:hypothetical protein